ncbi:MAG TPA: sulfatase [Thermomicrobiales bacterium]|jgi:arylsulfatase A-like enzyme
MAAERRPNILLITCHDLGRFLGSYGIATVQTPALDAFAADGVRFTAAFCTAPQCSPSRASLFTGRYPHSNGVLGLTHAQFAWDLGPDERHLGQVLREAGYTTAMMGVHHESHVGTPAEIAARCGMETIALGGRGEEVSAAALAWLDTVADGERPFYLQLGYHEPHRVGATAHEASDSMGFIGDYIAPDTSHGVTIPPYLRDTASAREELAELQGAVRALDAAVGKVLAGLDERGLADDTIVLFTTDHGIALPRAKCSLYDPGLETALIVRYPARGWQRGRTIAALTSNVDLFPTLLEAVGLPVSARVQGRSLLAALDGQAFTPREAIFGEMTYHDYYDPRRCIRTAHHKLIVNFTAAPAFMDPSQSWRRRTEPIVPPAPALAYHPLLELYDLAVDPQEWQNLAEDPALAAIRSDLLAQLQRWMADTADPLLVGAVTPPLHRRALAALMASGG